MKALKNKTVVTILAAIICVVILGFSYDRRVKKKINAISVPVAKVDLKSRQEITSNDIEMISVAGSAMTTNIIRNPQDLTDHKYVNFNTKIPQGSFFYTNAVVEWSSMPDAAWSEISDENTIVSLAVNNKTTYGNSIYPGNKIDIYYKTYDDDLLVFGKLIEGITVLAVKDESGYHINQQSASQKNAVALIFSVPEDQHLLIRKAIYLDGSGSLVPVPRNNSYSQETNINSEYLVGLVNKRCENIPLDKVTTTVITEEENTDDKPIIEDKEETVEE